MDLLFQTYESNSMNKITSHAMYIYTYSCTNVTLFVELS